MDINNNFLTVNISKNDIDSKKSLYNGLLEIIPKDISQYSKAYNRMNTSVGMEKQISSLEHDIGNLSQCKEIDISILDKKKEELRFFQNSYKGITDILSNISDFLKKENSRWEVYASSEVQRLLDEFITGLENELNTSCNMKICNLRDDLVKRIKEEI